MEEKNLMPCWELQQELDEKSVMALLRSIAGVLIEIPQHEHYLDSNWSTGVRAYDWVRNYLCLAAEQGTIPGLKMISKQLDFVLAINEVPIQFSKDCISAPKKKHRLVRNHAEYEQMSLFGESEPEIDIIWRVLAEPYYIEDTDEYPQWDVALVGINQYGVKMSEIRCHETVSVPLTDSSESLPEAADINDVPLKRRNAPDETVKKDGTV
ncbi:hypothetical protein AB7309_08240 [Providencia manganoxydans]|uniref:hypothetical protein n=1 Tax=Providencia manganoxydans TaxID=2923283 RepID=UPI0034E3AEF4